MTASRAYHHGNLREVLLDAALATVRRDGTDALSLRELAREAGVSHAAPRRHFADRQALLDALALAGFRRLGETLGAALSEAGDRFEQRLGAVARAYIAFADADPDLLELMFAGKHRPGAEPIEAAADAAFAPMLALISQGQAQGALSAGDPERVGLVLLAQIQGIASLHAGGMVPDELVEPLIDDGLAVLLRGAQPPA